ncbi:Metallo-dependent phosphatase-like protein [Stachybotrys elegans]|uniref:Metallo-dependent phosphatase-like protein n=1 Tax=Stachybotrys elegans TaxID=80388 RepID=A0A8K0SHE6_9HYPO|nr:Metallo-dependent phosphatase-like protein [Stachybotrys elegans]
MTRRIVRTIIQVAAAASFTFLVVLLLDRNYRVLPNSIHGYMPSHHPGLVVVDVTVTSCSSINIFSTCELDPNRWHRIPKELYLGETWNSKAFLHVSRKREEDLTDDDSVVMDVSVGRLAPASTTDQSKKWERRPGGIWILRSTKKKSSDSADAVTDLDVLFGDDAAEAREGWSIVGTPLLLTAGSPLHSAHITVRRGHALEPKKPKPRIRDNGRFKIMQIADMHLSTGVGACRDAIPDSYKGGSCEADPRTLDFVTKILEDEKPDFVVFSGDQVNGDTAPDATSAILKYAAILTSRKIPYASIFGNHDDEKTTSRKGQMALLETLPYSLAQSGPSDISGVGNYYVEVLARGNSDHSALTVYLLDSHAYSPDEHKYPGYDWIKPNQVEWFKKTATGLKAKHKEYTHRHMDIAFIHIPLPEYRDKNLARLGQWKEGVTAPKLNTGFRDALVEQGVVMVSAGHDHCNDYCSLSTVDGEKETPALWMCYAGGSGFGGYAGYGGFHRRVRVFDIDTNVARITTWKRLEYGDVESQLDKQVIVEGGKPVKIQR